MQYPTHSLSILKLACFAYTQISSPIAWLAANYSQFLHLKQAMETTLHQALWEFKGQPLGWSVTTIKCYCYYSRAIAVAQPSTSTRTRHSSAKNFPGIPWYSPFSFMPPLLTHVSEFINLKQRSQYNSSKLAIIIISYKLNACYL